jgi:arylsulfatase A-like enzyme
MEQRGVFDDSIVIVLADHGEEFFEHGEWQHDQVFEECLRVPLMIRMPGGVGGGTRIDTPVALMDVMPTVIDLLGVDTDELDLPGALHMQGESLAQSVVDGTEPSSRPIVSEYRADRKGGPLYDWQVAIYNEGLKYIVDEHRSKDGEKQSLFDLRKDADEQDNLAAELPDAVERFRKLRAHFLADVEALGNLERLGSGESLGCDELRQLVELGYLDGAVLKDCD